MNKVLDFLMKIVFLVCACISIAAVITICVFMFANGVPAIKEIGITKFLFGTQWRVSQNLFGIWPMIVGSIYVTAGAMIIGVPIGLLTAVFLAKYCPKKLYKFILEVYFETINFTGHLSFRICIFIIVHGWTGCGNGYERNTECCIRRIDDSRCRESFYIHTFGR